MARRKSNSDPISDYLQSQINGIQFNIMDIGNLYNMVTTLIQQGVSLEEDTKQAIAKYRLN